MALSTIPTRALSEQGINFRNLIINGDMSIAQRGTSFSGLGNGDSKYTLDRMLFSEVGTPTYDVTIAQDTTVPSGQGFSNSLKLTVQTAETIGAGNGMLLVHNIEAQNLQHLKYGTSNAESITLSFWVRSSETGTAIARLRQPDNSDKQQCQSYTISSANTWEKKTVTFTGDTSGVINNDNGSGLQLGFWLNAGSNFTSGTLPTTWTAYSNSDTAVGQTINVTSSTSSNFYITGVQLEVGTSASDFEFLPYDVNLQRCQRYYQKIHDTDGIAATTTEYRSITGFQPTMRSAPSLSVNGPYEISDLYTFDAIQSSATISTIGTITNTRAFIQMVNFSSLTQGRFYAGPRLVNNDYYIFADAEL